MSLSAHSSTAPTHSAETRPLDPRFAEYRASGDRSVRDALIEDHRWVAIRCVRGFMRKGVPTEDLDQVAMMGLVKAVDRFDPELGYAFTTFAMPTILGELRRYFRDFTWSVRVHRRTKENHLAVTAVVGELQQALNRAPTIAEIAQRADLSVEDTVAARDAGHAYRAAPLVVDDEESDTEESIFGVDEPAWFPVVVANQLVSV